MIKPNENFPSCESCIKANSIFKNLTPEQVQEVNLVKGINHYKRGNIIYHEGNRISGFYCINQGIIKIFKTGIDGKEQIIRFAKPGDIIGYRSILSNELACTTAKVIEDAEVCFIPGDMLVNLVKVNGEFSIELMRLTCRELGDANAYITDIAQKTVRERLAEILIQLKNNFGLDDDQFLQITLTREELANIVGTATESVIRLLSEFKHDQFIELHGRKIRILNINALNKIANLM